MRDTDRVSIFYIWISIFPSTIWYRGCLFSCVCFWHFCKESNGCCCGFISVFPIRFHWGMCLYLCKQHSVLVTVILQCNLKSGIVIPPASLFCVCVGLHWPLGSFVFLYEFQDFSFTSVKYVIEILMRISMDLQIPPGIWPF